MLAKAMRPQPSHVNNRFGNRGSKLGRRKIKPSTVAAMYVDFFKGEQTTKIKPGCLDDCLLQKVMADILKAFVFPSREDAPVWARYGCTS